MGLVDRLNSGVDRLASKFSSMQEGGGQFGDLIQDQPGGGSFGGMVGGGGASSFGNLVSGGGGSRFGSLIDGAQRPSWLSGIGQGARSMINLDWLEGPGGLNSIRAQKAAVDAAAKGPVSQGQPLTGNTGAITGIDPAVAQWADQANKTFGDLGPDMPDVMLAIMTNESGGKPTAYNAAGNAYGLFQQVGLNSWDPNVQFSSAKQLAQQKLASIAQSYAANGLNPDQRTRARDIALAWAGHFDYDTGRPNPNSKDIGSRQTADQLSAIFLANYDKIKAGRQAAPAGGRYTGGTPGLASITGGTGKIGQEFGDTDYSATSGSLYDYGAQYGVHGHTGIDWAVPPGTQVYMPAGLNGTVITAGGTAFFRDEDENPATVSPQGQGELKIQMSDGTQLILGHMRNISVPVGTQLTAGQLVGLAGSANGGHVHVEVRVPDRSMPSGYRIVDPRAFLAGPTGGGGTAYR